MLDGVRLSPGGAFALRFMFVRRVTRLKLGCDGHNVQKVHTTHTTRMPSRTTSAGRTLHAARGMRHEAYEPQTAPAPRRTHSLQETRPQLCCYKR